MSSRVEKLIQSGTWSLLTTPTEKLITVWFATKYPGKPLESLVTEIPVKVVMQAISNTRSTSIRTAIGTITANKLFVEGYGKLQKKCRRLKRKGKRKQN